MVDVQSVYRKALEQAKEQYEKAKTFVKDEKKAIFGVADDNGQQDLPLVQPNDKDRS